jgi:hypothetical protein
VERVTVCWPVIMATESPPDVQSAGQLVVLMVAPLIDWYALVLDELGVMKIYHSRLILERSAAATIRRQIVRFHSPGADGRYGRGCDITVMNSFCDGVES